MMHNRISHSWLALWCVGAPLAAILQAGVLQAAVPQERTSPTQTDNVGRSLVQRLRAINSPRPVVPGQNLAVTPQFPSDFRSIDGSGNNLSHPSWGAADTPFLRFVPHGYADGASAPAGEDRNSPRAISSAVAPQAGSMLNTQGASDYLWQWGQFLDHDLDETPVADPSEPFDIQVPEGDAWFDPQGTGTVTIPLDRSSYDDVGGVREQVNLITAYIDASQVYGSDAQRAAELRTLDGTGRLRTSAGNLLPYNENGLHNAPSDDPSFFLAGDLRANEQVGLTAMHTLFVREHNFWAGQLDRIQGLDGETIYQIARALVAAEMQVITYREFLPLLLGPGAIPPYQGYDDSIDPSITNVFATAAYRFGHTMLSPQLLRLDADGNSLDVGPLALRRAFFNPRHIEDLGIEPFLRGLAAQTAQEIDTFIIDDVRNFLFGRPGSGGFDLASLNIQRGRDHGLGSYNQVRQAYGHPAVISFQEISSLDEVCARMHRVYDEVDDIDAWVGLLAEDHAPGAMVGSTLHSVLRDQFLRLRDGDRFWYQNYLPGDLVQLVESQRLSDVIRRNTDIDTEIPDNVFLAQ